MPPQIRRLPARFVRSPGVVTIAVCSATDWETIDSFKIVTGLIVQPSAACIYRHARAMLPRLWPALQARLKPKSASGDP
jgi:hypothetical protein